jgi:hypothetical protein
MPADIKKFLIKYNQEEWDEKNSEDFAGIQERRAMEGAATAGQVVQSKNERERELARKRKRKQRAREKELEISSGVRSSDGGIKKVCEEKRVREMPY